MSDIRIDKLNPGMHAQYSNFLADISEALIYHSVSYMRMLETHLGCTPLYFIAKDSSGDILGVLPVMLSKTGTYGAVANSLPFYGSNGGILLRERDGAHACDIRTALLDACMEQLRQRSCASFTMVTNPLHGHDSWYDTYFGNCLHDRRIGLLTPLPENGPDAGDRLLSLFDNPRPQNIRKAIKSGIKCRYSHTLDDLQFLYNTHRDNIHSIGGIAKEEEFFKLLPNTFSTDEYRVYIAMSGDVPVAALLLFYFNRTVEYFTPAVLHEYRSQQPLSLLIFEGMKDAAARGYENWNWGGTWISQKGVYDFKRKWGSEQHNYEYYTTILDAQVLSSTPEELLSAYPYFFVLPFSELRT